LQLINCIIEHNRAVTGGGIFIEGGQVYLEGNTFRYNNAEMYGGGLISGNLTTDLAFAEDNRNNFYYNNAITGDDIFNSLENNGLPTDIVVDTFTVMEPYNHEFYQGEGNYDNQNYETRFDMLHPMRERVYTDMYISPDGDDENSGITPDEPMQTLNRVLHFITGSEDNPLTIHLANGIYSTELNDQHFPINLRSYVSIIGESVENTIIELNGIDQRFAIDLWSDLGYEIKNLTITNGYMNAMTNLWARIINIENISSSVNTILLENLHIIDNQYMQLFMICETNAILRNIVFENNIYYPASRILRNYSNNQGFDCTVLMENCISRNNISGSLNLDSAREDQGEHNFYIVNCEFSDNEYHNNFTDYSAGISVFCIDMYNLKVINSTFAGNIFNGVYVANAPFRLAYDIDAEIINTIIYDNETEYSIILRGNSSIGIPVLDVHHCIIENGYDSVCFDGFSVLNWDEETISDRDPLFMYEGEYPYSLQEDSPAIDMGTLDLPEGITLPQYDLAGNQRIRGNGIDLGAYEYNPFGNSTGDDVIAVDNSLLVYPNPISFNSMRDSKVKILWMGESSDELSIDIFNIKGQRIRTLKIQNSQFRICEAGWDLCDESGKLVSSGVYFVRIKAGDNYIAQQKMTMVK